LQQHVPPMYHEGPLYLKYFSHWHPWA
jgi:hypothetical protein